MSMAHAATACTVIGVAVRQVDMPADAGGPGAGSKGAFFQNVANAANRVDQFRAETVIDLAPQAAIGHDSLGAKGLGHPPITA